MTKDGAFDILSVKRTLYVNNIEANSITLSDTTLRGNVHTSGKRVKELYEAQQNTNCYCDKDKETVNELQNIYCKQNDTIIQTPPFIKLVSHSDIDDEHMPDNTYVLCLDDNNDPMYKLKVQNEIKFGSIATSKPYINVELFTGTHMAMSLSSTN